MAAKTAVLLTLLLASVGCAAMPAERDPSADYDGVGGKADEWTDCQAQLTEEEELRLVQAVAELNDRYFAGLMGAADRDWQVERLLLEADPDLDPHRTGAAKALVGQVNDATAAEFVLQVVNRRRAGRRPTWTERQVIVGLGMDDGQIDPYLDQIEELFGPYRRSLEERGATFDLELGGWNLEELLFHPEEIREDEHFATALILFFAPALADELGDAGRTETVVTRDLAFLPPAEGGDIEGMIRVVRRDAYEAEVAGLLDGFAEDVDAFLRASRESNSFLNRLGLRLSEIFGWERGVDGRSAPEIAHDEAYGRMRSAVRELERLGVSRDLLRALYSVQLEALQIDLGNLEAGTAKLELAFQAVLTAPLIPLLIYAAPIIGASLGATIAVASARAATVLAVLPMALAVGSATINAAIDSAHHGGNFSCFFLEEIFQKGAAALYVAPFMAAIPSLVASGGALAGLVTGSPSVAVTTYGILNLGVAGGFVGHMGYSGITGLAECSAQLERAGELSEEPGQEALANALSADAWQRCVEAGVDLSFSIAGGVTMGRAGYRALAERRAGEPVLLLVDRETGRALDGGYYERLGLPREASLAEIQLAYERLSTSLPAGSAELRGVTEAYLLLSDLTGRSLYDQSINVGAHPPPAPPETMVGRPAAREVLGRGLSEAEQAAVDVSHRVGSHELGRDGVRPAAVGNYTPLQVFRKARVLRDAGFEWGDIRVLMEAGVVGRPAGDLVSVGARARGHQEIVTDLFHGRVVEARPFSAHDNRNSLFKVRVQNPRTGRSRETLFKPRSWGDGEGWNRVPMEFVAYEVNRMLGMDYVPPVAYRRNIDVSFQHFEEGALLHLVPRARELAEVPVESWGVRRDVLLSDARVLDVLLQNQDRHLGNFMHGEHWSDGRSMPVFIDHGASFRPAADIRMNGTDAFGSGPITVVRRTTWDALHGLDFHAVKGRVGEFVSDAEIGALLSRRDGIIRYFEGLIAERGEGSVIADVRDF